MSPPPTFPLGNPLDDMAKALLAHAETLPGVVGGRTGEGGTIPQTPYVEVGDGRGQIVSINGGGGRMDDIAPAFVVIFYERYNGAQPEEQKRVLRGLFYALYKALKNDQTLGGLVESCAIVEFDSALTDRNSTPYWFHASTVTVRLEETT